MRSAPDQPTYTAFAGHRRLASGAPDGVAKAAAEAIARGESHVLIFDDRTGEQVELGPPSGDPRIVARSAPAPKTGRGRPKLGVVAREVTLLPRHWEWLSSQPGGASAALRRLVEAASRLGEDPSRRTRDRAYSVMSALAGNLPGYEDATRALFRDDESALRRAIDGWPEDVVEFVVAMLNERQT
jgi:uncharacterized protein